MCLGGFGLCHSEIQAKRVAHYPIEIFRWISLQWDKIELKKQNKSPSRLHTFPCDELFHENTADIVCYISMRCPLRRNPSQNFNRVCLPRTLFNLIHAKKYLKNKSCNKAEEKQQINGAGKYLRTCVLCICTHRHVPIEGRTDGWQTGRRKQ